MSVQRAAEVRTLLQGVPLPASKHELIAYARGQDEQAAEELSSIPDREYRSLDEVREELAPVRSHLPEGQTLPSEESGEPPGGDAYLTPHADSGAVRPSAPVSNPPQKTLEQQTKAQKEQQERQEELG